MAMFCLIDAHSLCYRAFYAVKSGLMTSYGQPTNAIYGFMNIFNKIKNDVKPDYIAVCFDVAKPTIREKQFKEYKIHRAPMPDDLRSQIPLIKEIMTAQNISVVEKEGFEADDVIATLARKAQGKCDVTIVTSDKDMLQLVDEHVSVYNPHKDDGVRFTADEVKKQFGVEPQHIVDLLSLMGDASDNIPGAKGIGEKTARELLDEFQTTDKLLKNIDKIHSDKIKTILRQSKDDIEMSHQLATLYTDLDVDCDLKQFSLREPDYEKLYALYSKLEFKSLLKSIGEKTGALVAQKGNEELPQVTLSTATHEALKEAKKAKAFAFSLTTGEEGLEVSLSITDDVVYLLKDKKDIALLLSDETAEKIGFDMKHAMGLLAKHDIELKGNYFDVMIAAYVLDPARSDYELPTLAYDFLKIGPLTQEALRNKEAVVFLRLKDKFEKELKSKTLEKLFYDLEIPLVRVLSIIERNGIKVDVDKLKVLSRTFEKKLNGLTEEIFSLAGKEFNINSPKQLREILFDKLKLPVVKKTKTGPSTDEEVLTKLAESHKLPSMILEFRQIMKLKSTYVDTLPLQCDQKTHRIHSTFLQNGTETGRLSSQNPNLQNIPIKTELGREIRAAFIAQSSRSLLLSCDYSQIELRILAHLSKDPILIDAFKKDADIHTITAALVYHVEPNDVQPQMRETAKRVNFGIIYGISAYGLSKDLKISVEVAQDFIDAYFIRYPKVKDYLNSQIAKARSEGFVSTIMGRRRYLPFINVSNMGLRQFNERQAVNAPIQGSAADIIKLAMITIQSELEKQKLETKMVLQVHDELVFDFPKSEQKTLLAVVKKGMEEVIELSVPLKASMKIGENWNEMEEIK